MLDLFHLESTVNTISSIPDTLNLDGSSEMRIS